jgi:hypothetical protein
MHFLGVGGDYAYTKVPVGPALHIFMRWLENGKHSIHSMSAMGSG